MKYRILLGLAVATLGAAATFSVNAQTGGGSSPSTATGSGMGSNANSTSVPAPGVDLNKLDTNKDGVISKSEARKDKELSKAFGSLDANHDGKLDASEIAAYGSSGSMGGPKP